MNVLYLAGIILAILFTYLILNRKKKAMRKGPIIKVVADHDWLKPACKRCPYFIPGGDSKNKEEFSLKGPTRCVRPLLENCIFEDSAMLQQMEEKRWLQQALKKN